MTGLSLYRSNHLEVLGKLLSENVHARPPADPFTPLSIVVGSRGMERWLRHTLADRSGICANLLCPFPAATIDRLIAATGADEDLSDQLAEPGADPWAPPCLTWAMLAVLPDLVDRPAFAPLASYASWSGDVSAITFGLARQIADVFDRYITYRPEVAAAWSADGPWRPPPELASAVWQPQLWRAVRAQLGDAPHRGELLAAALVRLRAGQTGALKASLGGQPLRIFGVSTLPPSWLDLLGAVAAHVPVELYLLCPSAAWWEQVGRQARARPWRGELGWQRTPRDDVAEQLAEQTDGHPLLISLGRTARDFQIALQAQDLPLIEHDLFIDRVQADPDRAGSVLHRLQADILHARPLPGGAERTPLVGTDDSIQLHACHGLGRQVEVLREVLLGLFADHPDLEPRDVVVMCPDIAAAAPLITATFERGRSSRKQRDGQPRTDAEMWGEAGAPRIPFTIADLSVRRLNPVADALLRVLELVGSRVEASAVLDLLALEPVQRRFDLDDAQVVTIQAWIQDSGIRWGVDGPGRAPILALSDEQNTWRFGLRRLLAGVVMADDGRLLGDGSVLPFDAMEGGQTALLGRLVDFCNTLFDLVERLAAPRPLDQWVRAAHEVVDRMTATGKAATWLTRRVRTELDGLAREGATAQLARPVHLHALRSALDGRFEVASRIAKDLSGAVTFCAMAPMRSLPHRVVCLIGLDEGALPRRSGGLAFDLCARRPRVGDRDPRDEDRYLLLEAVLAARDHLVLTWTGRDLRTNEACAPCVPVVELCHVLDETFAVAPGQPAASRQLLTEHPLQAFSPRNFLPHHHAPGGRSRPWSFDRGLCAAATASRRVRQAAAGFAVAAIAPVEDLQTLTLDTLQRWLLNPSQQFMLTRLKVDLADRQAAVADREPIVLDGLQRWSLRNELLSARLAGQSTAAVVTRLRALGQLPLGQAGALLVAEQLAVIDAMLAKIQLLDARDTVLPFDPAVPIDVTVAGVRLTGTLERVRADLLLALEFGKEDGKRLLRPWLQLLAWQAMAPERRRQAVIGLADQHKGAPKPELLGLDSAAHAPALLAELVALYRRGQSEPLPLFPGASHAFAKVAAVASRKGADDQISAADLAHGLPTDGPRLERLAAALDKATDAFAGEDSRGRTDMDDPAVAWLYEGRLPMRDLSVSPVPLNLDFARLALTVWGPLLSKRRTSKAVEPWLPGAEVAP